MPMIASWGIRSWRIRVNAKTAAPTIAKPSELGDTLVVNDLAVGVVGAVLQVGEETGLVVDRAEGLSSNSFDVVPAAAFRSRDWRSDGSEGQPQRHQEDEQNPWSRIHALHLHLTELAKRRHPLPPGRPIRV